MCGRVVGWGGGRDRGDGVQVNWKARMQLFRALPYKAHTPTGHSVR